MPDAPAATLSTAWTDSYTRRSRRPATIPGESQAGPMPFDNNIWDSLRQPHIESGGQCQRQRQQSAETKNVVTTSRPFPTELQQDQSIFEHDQYHPQQTAYIQQQQQPHYQAYHPSCEAIDYQQQLPQQEEQQAPPTPWPTFPPPAQQMRRDSSRTLAPTTAPGALDSVTELAARSFSLPVSRDVTTRGSGSGRMPPTVAVMVVMNPSRDEGALQTYSGSTLDGYNHG